MKPVKAALAAGMAAAACVLWGEVPASAQLPVTVTPGRERSGEREENVRLAGGQTGPTVTGVTARTGLPVLFSSFPFSTLTVPETGPDRVESANPGGSQIFSLTVALPGGAFTDLIANVLVAGEPRPGAALNVAVNTSAGTFVFVQPLERGNNVFSVAAEPGVTINSVTFTGNVMQGVATTFTALRPLRISGAAPSAAAP